MSEEQGFELRLSLLGNYRFEAEFDQASMGPLLVDEPAPLGESSGPNAARLLGTAVANCMSSSLLFCLRKSRIPVERLEAQVKGTIARNERGRLRVKELHVTIRPEIAMEYRERATRCLELFEDFCIVGQSVRAGVDVAVEVEPMVPSLAGD